MSKCSSIEGKQNCERHCAKHWVHEYACTFTDGNCVSSKTLGAGAGRGQCKAWTCGRQSEHELEGQHEKLDLVRIVLSGQCA